MFAQRFQLFIDEIYKGDLKEFSQVTGINLSALYKYRKTSLPDAEALGKMEENAGVSISWLITGNGDMFANNAIGKALRKKHVGKDLPQTVEEVLGADTKEALRRALSEVMERFTG